LRSNSLQELKHELIGAVTLFIFVRLGGYVSPVPCCFSFPFF
jgi:hypothetical protein